MLQNPTGGASNGELPSPSFLRIDLNAALLINAVILHL
jgi:hypothetical protein